MPRLDLEAGREATGQRLALDDRHAIATLREAQGDGQAQGAGAQDGGGLRHRPKPTRVVAVYPSRTPVPGHQGHTGGPRTWR